MVTGFVANPIAAVVSAFVNNQPNIAYVIATLLPAGTVQIAALKIYADSLPPHHDDNGQLPYVVGAAGAAFGGAAGTYLLTGDQVASGRSAAIFGALAYVAPNFMYHRFK